MWCEWFTMKYGKWCSSCFFVKKIPYSKKNLTLIQCNGIIYNEKWIAFYATFSFFHSHIYKTRVYRFRARYTYAVYMSKKPAKVINFSLFSLALLFYEIIKRECACSYRTFQLMSFKGKVMFECVHVIWYIFITITMLIIMM